MNSSGVPKTASSDRIQRSGVAFWVLILHSSQDIFRISPLHSGDYLGSETELFQEVWVWEVIHLELEKYKHLNESGITLLYGLETFLQIVINFVSINLKLKMFGCFFVYTVVQK